MLLSPRFVLSFSVSLLLTKPTYSRSYSNTRDLPSEMNVTILERIDHSTTSGKMIVQEKSTGPLNQEPEETERVMVSPAMSSFSIFVSQVSPNCSPPSSPQQKRLSLESFPSQDDDITVSRPEKRRKTRELVHRRVCFSDSSLTKYYASTHSHDILSPRYRSKIWYSRGELRDIRQKARDLMNDARAHPSELTDRLLSEVYYTSKKGEEEVAIQLSDSLTLNERRGLEKLVSRHHMVARCTTVFHSRVEVVLGHSLIEKAESYHRASLPASRFARVLGIADSLALQDDTNNS